MKFVVTFYWDKIQLSLTENLKLSEGRLLHPELPCAQSDADHLQQIEALARQFLEKLVADRGGSV